METNRYATKKKGKTECQPFWNISDIKNVVEWFEKNNEWDGYLITLFGLLLGRRIGDTIMIKGFIPFSVKDRAARVCRNPKTNEEIILPASKTVKCKLSKPFIDEVISGGGGK